MAYNALNNLIDAYIYANGVQAITGQILNGVLKQMVSQLGSGYHLMGVAGPETVPASNDYAMAYFAATAGEYTDFGGITLAAGEVAVLLTSGNGSWAKQTIYNVPTTTADLENTANFITNAVTDLVNYYTKTEVDTTLADYPTLAALATALADYYTKTEIDEQKAETDAALANRYTKSETDTKLSDYYRKTETYDKDEVDSIVAALSRQEYIVAWDGLAAPDVSAIPSGVTVTYSGTTYTGTLAASASTVNKIYMVWNGVAYDMYGTSQDGGYSWVPMGTTTVDLSQYATKAELSQLEAKVSIIDTYSEIDGSLKSGLVVNDSNELVSVPSPNYTIAYISATADSDYYLTFQRNNSYDWNGKVFIVASETNIAAGNTVSFIEQISLGEKKTISRALLAGQCLCVECRIGSGIVEDSVEWYVGDGGEIGALDSDVNALEGRVNSLDNKDNEQDKQIDSLNVPALYSMIGNGTVKNLVVNGSSLESVVSPYYIIAYVKATKNASYCVRMKRNKPYDTDGSVFVVNNETDIANGTSINVLAQVSEGDSLSYCKELTTGQCLCVSCVIAAQVADDVVEFGEKDEEKTKLSIPTTYPGRDMSVFNKILCIGDSLTYGVFNREEIPGQTWPSQERANMYSYPTILAKLTGCTVLNIATGGFASYDWWNAYQNDARLEGADCAIIQLGVNDDEATLTTRSASAFTNIIGKLKQLNKGIKIFLSGIINSKSYPCKYSNEEYYAKDQFLRNYYETNYANDEQVFFIDHARFGHLRDLDNLPGSDYPLDNYNEGHLSAYGYGRLAMDYYSYISWIMASDKNNVFREIQFIGTDYTFG